MRPSTRQHVSNNYRLRNDDIDKRLNELYGEDNERDTILYCEDDEVLRKLMTELLGHICPNKNVKGVASADMAIQTLKDDNLQLRQKIAFIISDYNMPPGKKTGGDLALYLRTILKDHKMPFILNSGNPAINLEDYDGVIDVFTKKPLKMNEIAPNIINAIKTRILSALN